MDVTAQLQPGAPVGKARIDDFKFTRWHPVGEGWLTVQKTHKLRLNLQEKLASAIKSITEAY